MYIGLTDKSTFVGWYSMNYHNFLLKNVDTVASICMLSFKLFLFYIFFFSHSFHFELFFRPFQGALLLSRIFLLYPMPISECIFTLACIYQLFLSLNGIANLIGCNSLMEINSFFPTVNSLFVSSNRM